MLTIVGGATTVGVGLSGAIVLLRRPNASDYWHSWKKFGVLLAIVLVFVSTANFGLWGLLPLTGTLAILGWRELINGLTQKYSLIPHSYELLVTGVTGAVSGVFVDLSTILFSAIGVLWGAIALSLLRRSYTIPRFFILTFGTLCISLPLAMLLAIGIQSYGQFTFLTLLVMGNDGFSEGIGRFLGRTPLCPTISPKKTWEGAIGGVLASALLGYALRLLLVDWPLWQVILTAGTLSLLSLLGDLCFSALKRELEIKDFGQALWITGGVLDKFDGLLFAVPVFYAIAHFWTGGP